MFPKIGHSLCCVIHNSRVQTDSGHWRQSKYTPWTHTRAHTHTNKLKFYTFLQNYHHYVPLQHPKLLFFWKSSGLLILCKTWGNKQKNRGGKNRKTAAGGNSRPAVFWSALDSTRLRRLPSELFSATLSFESLISRTNVSRYSSLSQAFWAHCLPLW